jgi:hypothetical protein
MRVRRRDSNLFNGELRHGLLSYIASCQPCHSRAEQAWLPQWQQQRTNFNSLLLHILGLLRLAMVPDAHRMSEGRFSRTISADLI